MLIAAQNSFANLPPHARILPPEDFGVVMRDPKLNLGLHHQPVSDDIGRALDFVAVQPLTLQKSEERWGDVAFVFTFDFLEGTKTPLMYGSPLFETPELAPLLYRAMRQAKIYNRAVDEPYVKTALKMKLNNDLQDTWAHFHPVPFLIEVLKGPGTIWWENSDILRYKTQNDIDIKDEAIPRQLVVGDNIFITGSRENGLVHAIAEVTEESPYRAIFQTSPTNKDRLKVIEANMIQFHIA